MLATLAGLAKVVQYTVGILRKLARLTDDLTGEPPRPGMPSGRPGILDRLIAIEDTLSRLSAMESRIAAVEAQVRPNSSTVRDAADRLTPQPGEDSVVPPAAF